MNENDLPGDVIGIGSSLTAEGVEKQLEALRAAYAQMPAYEAWQALHTIHLMSLSFPDTQ